MTDEEAALSRQATIRQCNLILTVSIGTLVVWALIDYRSLIGAIVWGYIYCTLIGIPLAIAMWFYTRRERRAASSINRADDYTDED